MKNNENKLPEIFETFLYSIEHARCLSSKTVRAYRTNLECFNNHMFSGSLETNIEDIATLRVDNILIKWLNKLKSSGMKTKSLNQRISTIRSMYKYYIGEQLLSLDVSRSIPLFPEVDAEEKQPLTLEECFILLNKSEEILNSNYNYENLRNFLIINLFLGIGIRREEMSLLNFSNFNLSDKTITLRYDQVKGKKRGRTIAIPQMVIDVYNQYLTLRLPMNADLPESLHESLFISKKKNNLSVDMISLLFKNIAKQCDLEISCHHLRHTYASLLCNCSEAELYRVSKNLGHSNLDITKNIYVHDGHDNTGEVNPIFNRKNIEAELKKDKPTITKDDSNLIQIKWA